MSSHALLAKGLAAVLGSMPVGTVIPAKVVRVVDGDTVLVDVTAWRKTPWNPVYLRVYGIDTPEVSTAAGAHCNAEIQLGLAAQAFGRTLAPPGKKIHFVYKGVDKYGGRIDAEVKLTAGTTFTAANDWNTIMTTKGFAKPYFGGQKIDWCTTGRH
jgi:endonuclease YncB( thermonuclease family)